MSHQQDTNGEFLFDIAGNRIPSGELIKNGNFHGGSSFWDLNQTNGPTANTLEVTSVSTATATLGDPVQGWFHGFDGNAIRAYDVLQYWGIHQNNIPIISGEKYKLTYTLSGYTSGEWYWHVVDINGDTATTPDRTANGTYEETITASTTTSSYSPQSIFFRSRTADTTPSNVTLDSVSLVRVGDEETSTAWSNYKSTTPSENQDDMD